MYSILLVLILFLPIVQGGKGGTTGTAGTRTSTSTAGVDSPDGTGGHWPCVCCQRIWGGCHRWEQRPPPTSSSSHWPAPKRYDFAPLLTSSMLQALCKSRATAAKMRSVCVQGAIKLCEQIKIWQETTVPRSSLKCWLSWASIAVNLLTSLNYNTVYLHHY